MFLNNAGEPWPSSPQADFAKRILPDFLRHRPCKLVANADVEMRLWQAGDQILPITSVPHGARTSAADVCSPWNHYVRYPLEEIERHGHGLPALLARAVLTLAIPVLRLSRIEHAILINSWLLSTNPPSLINRAAIEQLTQALRQDSPTHAFVFRTINLETQATLAANLTDAGYRLIAARVVYLFHPASPEIRKNKNVIRDRKILHDGACKIVDHDALTPEDMPRLAELHHLLYVGKHSTLNASYTPLFFETAWRNRLFEFRALRLDDRIVAYASFYELSGILYGSLVGYDTSLPSCLGLFRRSITLLLEEAARRGLPLHCSAGAGAFKHHRGGQPVVEYDAVFDSHLPLYRRLGWRLLQAAGILQHRKVQRGW